MAAVNTEHTLTSTEARVVDLAGSSVRALNAELHAPGAGAYEVLHPDGAHAIAAGLRHPLTVDVRGHAGYYCAGMNRRRRRHRRTATPASASRRT